MVSPTEVYKQAVAKAVTRQFPDASEVTCIALVTNILLCCEEAGVGLYLKEDDEPTTDQ